MLYHNHQYADVQVSQRQMSTLLEHWQVGGYFISDGRVDPKFPSGGEEETVPTNKALY